MDQSKRFKLTFSKSIPSQKRISKAQYWFNNSISFANAALGCMLPEQQQEAAKKTTYYEVFIVAQLDTIKCVVKKLLLKTQNYADSPEQMKPNNMNKKNLNINN